MSSLASQGSQAAERSTAQASPRSDRVETLVLAVEDKSGFWRVQLLGDALVYEHRTTGKPLEREEASPSDRDWRRFWASVERIGVWSWADAALIGQKS